MEKRGGTVLLGIILAVFGTSVVVANIRDNVVIPQFYQSTIDELFKKETPQVISSYLYDIQDQSFNLTVESQTYLYWKYAARNHMSPMYLRNLAYYIREMRQDDRFNSTSSETKERLNAVATHLPSSLRYLLLEKDFCLLNRNYSEYAYLATLDIVMDTDHRFVITSTKNSSDLQGRWVSFTMGEFKSNSGYLDMKVALKANDLFMYREEQKAKQLYNLVLAWRTVKPPASSFWSVELVDEKFLVFYQNGYIMCQPGDLYAVNQRYIFALNNKYTKNSPECQWIAKDCPPLN